MASFNITLEDSSPLVTYAPSGAWADSPSTDPLLPAYSSSSLHVTAVQGATASIQFNGTGITIFGGNRPNYGGYTITVDGQTIKSGSAQSQQDIPLQVLGTVDNLPNGPHTAVLTSTSTAPIDIDFINIQTQIGTPGSQMSVSTIDDSDQRITYLPSAAAWQTNSGNAFMGGTLHYTSTADAAASVAFSGDAFAVYGTVSPDHADIQISVDGQALQTLVGGSGGGLTSLHPQTLLYYGNNLGPGQHTLTVTCRQENGTGSFMDLDAVQVFSASGGQPLPTDDGNNNAANGQSGAPAIIGNTIDLSSLPAAATPAATPTAGVNAAPQRAGSLVGMPVGAIAGIAVGCAIALLGLLALILLLLKRRRNRSMVRLDDEQSPISPVLPLQKPYMVEAGSSLVSPAVEGAPRPLYRAPSRSESPFISGGDTGSMYSRSSMAFSSSRSVSPTPMASRNVPMLQTPRPPPMARTAAMNAAPTRPLHRPPTLNLPP